MWFGTFVSWQYCPAVHVLSPHANGCATWHAHPRPSFRQWPSQFQTYPRQHAFSPSSHATSPVEQAWPSTGTMQPPSPRSPPSPLVPLSLSEPPSSVDVLDETLDVDPPQAARPFQRVAPA